jgi:DNA-directed RNA polymerase subunit RPC12/RpoP
MAICTRCGTETELYDTGYAICAACLNASLAKPAENVNFTQNDAPLRLSHE